MAERTKSWIANMMSKLLQQKPIENIRVTEICREAEIERPTFYYHFKDKYGLMAWMFCQKALQTDVLSVESAAKAMNGMRQDFLCNSKNFGLNTWQLIPVQYEQVFTVRERRRNRILPSCHMN